MAERDDTACAPVLGEVVGAVVFAVFGVLSLLILGFGLIGTWLGHTETLEATQWLAGFVIGVPLGLIATRSILDGQALRPFAHTYWPSATFVVGLGLFAGRRLDSIWPSLNSTFWLSLLVSVASAGVWFRYREHTGASLRKPSLRPQWRVVLVGLGGVLWISAFLPDGSLRGTIVATVLVGFGVFPYRLLARISFDRRFLAVVAVVVPVAVCLLVWDVSFRPNPFDHDFFLGPANDVRHGRYVLVEVFSQYGVGVIYFISGALRVLRFGYGSFTLLLGVLAAFGAAAVYFVLRRATGSSKLAGAGALIVVVSGPIGTIGRVTQYPSVGFLRFGLTWLLVLALVMARRDNQWKHAPMILAYGLLGIAAIWSFEAAFYSFGTFVVTILVAAWAAGDIRGAFRPLLLGALAIALALVGLTIATRAGSGEYPQPQGYIDFIRLYSSGGFGTLPVNEWSLGYVICAGYVASFIALGGVVPYMRNSRPETASFIVPIVAVTTYGALTFTYFLGRSHPNNLHHISPPFIAMVVLWLGFVLRCRSSDRYSVASAALLVSIWSGALVVTTNWDALAEKTPDSALAAVLAPVTGKENLLDRVRSLRANYEIDARTVVVEELMHSAVPPGAPVLVLLDPAIATDVLIRRDVSNVLPLNAAHQDSLVPSHATNLVSLAAQVPCGTLAVTQTEPLPSPTNPAVDLVNGILGELQAHFTFRVVASVPGYEISELQCDDG